MHASDFSNDVNGFDIRNFTDQLEPAKEKGKYICPVCGGHNLSIDKKSTKYQCFNGCSCPDIREAIKPWAEVLEERKQQNNHVPPKKLKVVKPQNKPAAIPEGELAIAQLNEAPTDVPQPIKPHFVHDSVKKALLNKGVLAEELEQITVTSYSYGDKKYSHRYQAPSNTNNKGYEKTFSISRIDEAGKTWWNKGDCNWAAYRQDEAIAHLKAMPTDVIPVLLSHEGESCVEQGRQHKLAGITSLGNVSENELIRILSDIKSNVDRDFVLAHCQDNDNTGSKKADKLRKACEQVKIPFVAIDLKNIIPDLCDKGDIVDVLESGMTGDELAQAILEQIKCVKNNSFNTTNTSKKETNTNPTQPLGKDNEDVVQEHPEELYREICEELGLDFNNCVTLGNFDGWIYREVFGGGKGNWRVDDSAFYRWSEVLNVWQYQPDNRIHTLIADAGERAFKLSFSKMLGWQVKKSYESNSHKESAFKYIRSRLEREEQIANNHLLAFKNCVVDMRSGQTMPHNKVYYLTNIIPYDYEPNKPCPEVFLKFINDSFGEDMIEVIRAFTSMFLDPIAPYGRFPHLIGQSGGGKGTLGRFWSSLFGDEGSGSASHFSDISTPEGRHQYLSGKRIFGFPDMGGYAEGVRAFYELIDNGQMSGRALFNPVAYSKIWNIRFWLASVNHLQIENAGDGWARRAYPIPVKSRNVSPDPDLRLKLEACKADVISWALAMPRDLRDRILLSPPESERAINLALDAAMYGDSTKSFVDLCLRPSKSAVNVDSHQLHSWYTTYCKEHGYTPLGMSKFISHLKTVLPQNFIDRHWTPQQNGVRTRIQAHWEFLEPLAGAFTKFEREEQNDSGQKAPPSNPIWICIKSQCREGGLELFSDFWNPPETPEPSQGAGVRPVQASSGSKKEDGHAETQSQSGCPSCPSVPPQSSHAKNSEVEKNKIFENTPSISSVKLQVDNLDRTDTPATTGFQGVQEENHPKNEDGQGGHPDSTKVSADPTQQKSIEVGCKVRWEKAPAWWGDSIAQVAGIKGDMAWIDFYKDAIPVCDLKRV